MKKDNKEPISWDGPNDGTHIAPIEDWNEWARTGKFHHPFLFQQREDAKKMADAKKPINRFIRWLTGK